jgi:hypothetical protein
VLPLVVGHVLVACLGMAFVSVATFAIQFLYIALLYSIYMTLRTWIMWAYMVALMLNIISGIFTVFLLEGVSMFIYIVILLLYGLAIFKLKQDSIPMRNMAASEGGSQFYLESGLRHMLTTAREEYSPGRRGGADHNQRGGV